MNHPRALLWAYAATVAVALVVAASTSAAAFGAYNPAWDGASDLRAEADAVGADATVVTNTTAYGEGSPGETVAVVLSPGRAYGEGDAARLRSFVGAGGTLVVAEDYGEHANPLLAAVGADARVDGRPLRDERHGYRSPAMPVATNVTDDGRLSGVEQVTLNHGTSVRPNGATVLASTSGYAYHDGDRDGVLDDAESLGSYPVVTVEAVGDGQVVVVGDPSVLINAMLERDGNRRFVRSLFAGHERVLLDYSHAGGLPPLAAAVLALRRSALLQLLVGLAAVVGVGLWIRTPALVPRIRSPASARRDADESATGADEDALVAYLADRHPEWDEKRVRDLVAAARSADGERDDPR